MYLLGAERLFENEPTVEIEGVTVGDGTSWTSGSSVTVNHGAMTVVDVVKDGERSVAVEAEKVAAMLWGRGAIWCH